MFTVSDSMATRFQAIGERYVRWHGGPLTENPIPEDGIGDAVSGAWLEFYSLDWAAAAERFESRTGRPLFRDGLTPARRAERAWRYCLGRARVRRWRQPGQSQPMPLLADPDGFAGHGSLSVDPARIAAAAEEWARGKTPRAVSERENRQRRRFMRTRRGIVRPTLSETLDGIGVAYTYNHTATGTRQRWRWLPIVVRAGLRQTDIIWRRWSESHRLTASYVPRQPEGRVDGSPERWSPERTAAVAREAIGG